MSIVSRKRIRTRIGCWLTLGLAAILTYSSFQHSDRSLVKTIIIPPSLTNLQINDRLPTLTRVVYLILCENQAEVDTFTTSFPSITADVIYFCWKDRCQVSSDILQEKLVVYTWPHLPSHLNSSRSRISIRPRQWVINEMNLNLTERTTWTSARNLLLERALEEERHQGWRWAYFNFLDGDVRIDCPLVKDILAGNVPGRDVTKVADTFRFFINRTINKDQCFLLFDTFLLTTSPAIGTVANMGPMILFPQLAAQIVYHIDAMFNGFHRDVIPFLLPYCPRYDHHSWWTSQAILMYRSLCVYGHIIQFNPINVTRQIHRPYPRNGDPFLIDEDMNLVPESLMNLKVYMQRERTVSALVLENYAGWSLALTSKECRQHHTHIDPRTCRVID